MDFGVLEKQCKALRANVGVLQKNNAKLSGERETYKKLYLEMMEKCRKLELGILGQKAERLEPHDAQLTLSILNELLSARERTEGPLAQEDTSESGTTEVRAHERRKHPGRRPLPEHLPRIDIEVLPEEVQKEGLDTFEKIGQEVTETLERRVASLMVVRTIRPTFVKKEREKNAETEVFRAEFARPSD